VHAAEEMKRKCHELAHRDETIDVADQAGHLWTYFGLLEDAFMGHSLHEHALSTQQETSRLLGLDREGYFGKSPQECVEPVSGQLYFLLNLQVVFGDSTCLKRNF